MSHLLNTLGTAPLTPTQTRTDINDMAEEVNAMWRDEARASRDYDKVPSGRMINGYFHTDAPEPWEFE